MAQGLRRAASERILEALRREPGLPLRALSRAVSMREALVGKHLRDLAGKRIISSSRVCEQRRYYAARRSDGRLWSPLERERLAMLGRPRNRELLRLLAAKPRTTDDLTRELGLSRLVVLRELRGLRMAGFLTLDRSAERPVFKVEPSGLHLLDEAKIGVDPMRPDARETTKGPASS